MSEPVRRRVLDAALEDGGTRNPLKRMFTGRPVLTFKDALSSPKLRERLPDLDDSIKTAEQKAEETEDEFPALSADERAAITLYTMEETPREDSVYYVMNAALRDEDRKRVEPWADYIWLLLHSLRKLPAARETTVMRGCKKPAREMGQQTREGKKFTWSAFTSTATTVKVMEEFLGDKFHVERTMWQLQLSTPLVGRDVSQLSMFKTENEVLLPPNVRFEVQSVAKLAPGFMMVQCRQIETSDEWLDFGAPDAAFKKIDANDDGFISPSELLEHMRKEHGHDDTQASALGRIAPRSRVFFTLRIIIIIIILLLLVVCAVQGARPRQRRPDRPARVPRRLRHEVHAGRQAVPLAHQPARGRHRRAGCCCARRAAGCRARRAARQARRAAG